MCSRWIPHNMSNAQNKARVDWSKEMPQKYDHCASKQVYDIVTGNESWIYAYKPESKQQLIVWVFNPNPSRTKQKIACFSEKLDMSQSYH